MATKKPTLVQTSLAAVSDQMRQKNVRVLQPILTDLIAFGLNVKELHWNVIGKNFRPIHLHLDEIYSDVQEAIDEVAERISACGHSPLGTAGSVAKDTELEDVPSGFLKDDEVLLLASDHIHELIGLLRSRMQTIEDVDTVTADMLHQVVAKLEKHHWMLQAQRL